MNKARNFAILTTHSIHVTENTKVVLSPRHRCIEWKARKNTPRPHTLSLICPVSGSTIRKADPGYRVYSESISFSSPQSSSRKNSARNGKGDHFPINKHVYIVFKLKNNVCIRSVVYRCFFTI